MEADSARISWLEANRNVEISYEGWEDDVWEAYIVSGGRSDREWTKIARAADLRSTIDAARSALASSNKAGGGMTMNNNDDWTDEFERDWDDKEFHEKDNGPLRMVAHIVLAIIGASALAISLMLAFL